MLNKAIVNIEIQENATGSSLLCKHFRLCSKAHLYCWHTTSQDAMKGKNSAAFYRIGLILFETLLLPFMIKCVSMF